MKDFLITIENGITTSIKELPIRNTSNILALPDSELNALGYARAVIPDYDERFQMIWNGDVITSSALHSELVDGKAVFTPVWVSLEQAKSVATTLVHEQAKQIINAAASKYSEYEAARWTKLVEECQTFLNDGTASPFMLVASTDDSQEGLTAFAEEVLDKAQQFETLLAQTRKWRETKILAINQAKTPAEVKSEL